MEFFNDIPPSHTGRRRSEYDDIVAELEANPGLWGLVLESDDSTARQRIAHALRYRNIQAAIRGRQVFARWEDPDAVH